MLTSTDRHGLVSETLYNVRGQVVETRTPVKDQAGLPLLSVTRTVYDLAALLRTRRIRPRPSCSGSRTTPTAAYSPAPA